MRKILRFVVPLLLAVLVIASIFWYLFMYDRAFTRATLLSQGPVQSLHGMSRLASGF